MATTTIGSNPTTNFWGWDGAMTRARIGNYFISGLGRMIQVDFFAARVNAGGSGGASAWRSGTVQFEVTGEGFTLGNTGAGTPAQADASCSWHTATGDIPTDSGQDWQFGGNNSSGLYVPYRTGSDSTDVTHGWGFVTEFGTAGSLHGYGTYFILALYKKIGGTMTKEFVRLKRAGAWTIPKVYVKRGGVWIQVAYAGDIEFDPQKQYEAQWQDENGIWFPGILTWEGPLYLGPPGAREFHLYGTPELAPYELVAA
jgi:hypothetical protein